MSVVTTARRVYEVCAAPIARHVRSPNRLTTLANTGATIVWTHLPLYPAFVWLLVGRPVWPSLVILMTTPLFFSVPLVSRTRPTLGRALFVVSGVANTLLSVKCFGAASDVGWFLLPCLLIAATFFRLGEWKASGALSLFVAASALLIRRLQPPLHTYTPDQYERFANLNHWCVGCLAAYLVTIAARRQLQVRERN